MTKKFLAILLAFTLMLSLAACGGETAETEPPETPSPEVTEGPQLTEAPEKETTIHDTAYAKIDPMTPVMSINGRDVLWREYFCWVYQMAQQMEVSLGYLDWGGEVTEGSGISWSDYVKEYTKGMLVPYWVILEKAEELGLELDEEDKAQMEEMYKSEVETYGEGDEGKFADYLDSIYLDSDLYDKMNSASVQLMNIFAELYGQQGEKMSAEDVLSYARDHGYMRAQHILFKTKDDTLTELSPEEIVEAKENAEKTLAELQAVQGEERTALFATLMKERSEDEGSIYLPDGYYFTSGQMVAEFESGAAALEEGGMSGIIESIYGYHIILRLPMDPDGVIDGTGTTLRAAVAETLMQVYLEDLVVTAKVEYYDDFGDLEMGDIYFGDM